MKDKVVMGSHFTSSKLADRLLDNNSDDSSDDEFSDDEFTPC